MSASDEATLSKEDRCPQAWPQLPDNLDRMTKVKQKQPYSKTTKQILTTLSTVIKIPLVTIAKKLKQ